MTSRFDLIRSHYPPKIGTISLRLELSTLSSFDLLRSSVLVRLTLKNIIMVNFDLDVVVVLNSTMKSSRFQNGINNKRLGS